MRGLLRTYFPPLPRSVTTLQVGGLVNSFGNGIILPFLFIYLHNVRGIGLGVVGLIAGAGASASRRTPGASGPKSTCVWVASLTARSSAPWPKASSMPRKRACSNGTRRWKHIVLARLDTLAASAEPDSLVRA